MLADRRSTVEKLQKKRAVLQRRVDEVDRLIAAAGGTVPAPATPPAAAGRGRRRNAVSLGAAIAAVMDGKGPMSVGDVLEAVTAGGYRSGSANFRGIVNQALIKDERFSSAGRGLYVMK